jgi:hypothetical protein
MRLQQPKNAGADRAEAGDADVECIAQEASARFSASFKIFSGELRNFLMLLVA